MVIRNWLLNGYSGLPNAVIQGSGFYDSTQVTRVYFLGELLVA